MGTHIEATDSNFDAVVVNSATPTVVDFWAPWCGPCRQLAPVLDKVAAQYDGKVAVAKVNVDNNRKVAATYGIQGIPTLIAFKDGKVVARMTGFGGEKGLADFFSKIG